MLRIEQSPAESVRCGSFYQVRKIVSRHRSRLLNGTYLFAFVELVYRTVGNVSLDQAGAHFNESFHQPLRSESNSFPKVRAATNIHLFERPA